VMGVLAVVLAGAAVAVRHRPGPVRTGSAAAHGARIVRYHIVSGFVHRTLPQTAAVPAGGGRGRPLLVFLHGRGGDGEESNSNGEFYAALERLGERAPVVVFPNGGDHSYYHRRRSGDWARYVLDEVIPRAVRRFHADERRVAIGGVSMGGFGAYDIARMRAGRFCAVGGHSAALWRSGGESAPGAFDDASDFARHDLMALATAHGRAPWRGARLWLDGGSDDPFRSAGEAFATSLGVRMHHWPGDHEGAYWRAHYEAYLRFYAAALAAC
jgi:poly(3-hydroxybutyrate) depolymerase